MSRIPRQPCCRPARKPHRTQVLHGAAAVSGWSRPRTVRAWSMFLSESLCTEDVVPRARRASRRLLGMRHSRRDQVGRCELSRARGHGASEHWARHSPGSMPPWELANGAVFIVTWLSRLGTLISIAFLLSMALHWSRPHLCMGLCAARRPRGCLGQWQQLRTMEQAPRPQRTARLSWRRAGPSVTTAESPPPPFVT